MIPTEQIFPRGGSSLPPFHNFFPQKSQIDFSMFNECGNLCFSASWQFFFLFGVKCTTLWCNCVSKVGWKAWTMVHHVIAAIDIIDESWVSWMELMPLPWNMVDLDLAAKDSDIDFDDLATRQQTAHDSTITISRYVELEQFFGCPLDGPKPVKSQHGRSKGMMVTALDRGHDMTGWGCFVMFCGRKHLYVAGVLISFI